LVSDGEPDSRSPGESGGLEVRRFATGDARAVHALDDAAMRAAGARGRGDEDLDSVAAGYLEDGGEFLVGILDGRLIAIGALRHVTDAVAELNRMRVHPGFQRRGFGRTLLARLEHRASELGYRALRLHTPATQTPARRLYSTAGYREVGRGQLAGTEVVYFEKSCPV
jgi:ribosomal protein S18 acetylase RimI-like enzyme